MKNTNLHRRLLLGASPLPLHSRAWAFLLPAAAIMTLLLSTARGSFAGSATWLARPTTGDWNTAANWTVGGPPNGPSDTATFDVSTITGVSISACCIEVNSIVFNPGASAFTITAGPEVFFTISGTGIINNSGITQNFVAGAGETGNFGIISFENSATAGSLTAITNKGWPVAGMLGSETNFNQTSTAGSATITNNGGTVSGAYGGVTSFLNSSTAGGATIINNGGAVGGAYGGETIFYDSSDAGSATLIANGGGAGGGLIQFLGGTGGTARVEVFGKGTLDIFFVETGVTTGSIEGNGHVRLGEKNLTVGSNNLSTTFSGMIYDGGERHSGSLTKSDSGKLTLSGASTYSGGTTVSGGTLRVTNKSGSATGTGPVQVNAGTLAGAGIIDGAVTVGTGSSSRAIILPGKSATAPGILTINSALTFNSLSTYKCVLNRRTPIAGEITALDVTINNGASFNFVDVGTGTLTVGTVFTVINNTSANPISGTFSNLTDGSMFTSNGNNFQASYTGGDGNDLTLTVVP
jgi:autotransporter-associated beta strand protein